MPRKSDPTPPQDGVLMPVDAFNTLTAFQQELHGIMRTLQPDVLAAIGYPATQNHQLLRDVFHALAQRLTPVVAACVWTPGNESMGEPPGGPRLH